MRCLCARERQRHDQPLLRMMSKAIPLPPLSMVNNLLEYDLQTGFFFWKENRRNHIKAGAVAGYARPTKSKKYIVIGLKGKYYKAHRIAWLIATGCDPGDALIDHIDGDSTNNRFSNLRLATEAENGKNKRIYCNNSSGYKGVSYHKQARKWRADIRVDQKLIHLGLFHTPELAHMAYCKAAAELHGEFARAA
jgi:hypothetical protein